MRDNKKFNNTYKKNRYSSKVDILGDDVPTMHKAICDNCGKSCEVPFRPSNGKPVYCNNCYASMRDEPGTQKQADRRGYNRQTFEKRQMFTAVCDACGKKCEVPFRPSDNKPIYCSDCFEKKGNGSNGKNNKGMQDQLDEMDKKLDKLLQILQPRES